MGKNSKCISINSFSFCFLLEAKLVVLERLLGFFLLKFEIQQIFLENLNFFLQILEFLEILIVSLNV